MKRQRRIPLWTYPVAVILAIGSVWLRLSITRMNYAIGEADRKIHALQLDREKAGLHAAALRSPLKLEGLARSRFHLSQPRSEQVIHLDQRVDQREPASGPR